MSQPSLVSAVKMLIFKLGEHRFALPIAGVVETVRAVAVTPLPEGQPLIEGVINYRGQLAAVLDLRVLFGQAPAELAIDHHFIVGTAGGRLIALHVDRAERVVDIGDDPLDKTEGELPLASLITGVAKLPDGLILIPDLAKILSLAGEAPFRSEAGSRVSQAAA